jgi:enoyl-CoA hydratase/carnithine racemase
MARITYEKDGHLALIGFNRPEKRNAFDRPMFDELAQAYTRYEEDREARCAVVFAHGDHFTAGLDLAQIAPELGKGTPMFPAGQVDPLGLTDRRRTKPVVVAIRGFCLTIGIELALASDVIVCADDTRFSQIEVKRGLFAFGGATLRFPALAGWHNAMRWILTGDFFDAKEAYRMGLAQEVRRSACRPCSPRRATPSSRASRPRRPSCPSAASASSPARTSPRGCARWWRSATESSRDADRPSAPGRHLLGMYFASSSLAMALRCTSSGPSASRSKRAVA